MTQTVTIEVDDIPEGYEVVRFGIPVEGEQFLAFYGMKEVVTAADISCPEMCKQRFILRPIWKPPAWLKPGWIAMDKEGRWRWYANEPEPHPDPLYPMWRNKIQGSPIDPLWNFACVEPPFTPPPCADWKQSLRQIGGGP